MPRGKYFNKSELERLEKLIKEKWKPGDIATALGKGLSTIYRYLKKENISGQKLQIGRPTEITVKEKRAILRNASNTMKSAAKIKNELNVKASVRTVQRIIKACDYLKRKKIKRTPALKPKHIEARLSWAQEHMSWTEKWKKVVFSDEKKFNLDGPDGYDYYFHDLRKDPLVLHKRQMGGGSVMVWAAISYYGCIDLLFVSGRQNSQKYLELLKLQIIKIREKFESNNFIFQHDNAAIHSARIVKAHLMDSNVNVLQWPAVSPDLNIIEDVWGYLSRRVYAEGKQFDTVEELKNAIIKEWERIPSDFLKKLYESLPRRVFSLIKAKGGKTPY